MKFQILIIMLIWGQIAIAGSMEKAQLLYENGFTNHARLELIENIVSHNPQTSPRAYKMLGKIAFEERNFDYQDRDDKNFHLARGTWKRLIEKYPNSEASISVQKQYGDFINGTRKIDFYGIKSGMTVADLTKVLDLNAQAKKVKKENPQYSGKSIKQLIKELYILNNTYYAGEKFAGKWYGSLLLRFDSKGRLWMLVARIRVPEIPEKKQALKKMLTRQFGQFRIQKIRSNPSLYQVTLMDDRMALKQLY